MSMTRKKNDVPSVLALLLWSWNYGDPKLTVNGDSVTGLGEVLSVTGRDTVNLERHGAVLTNGSKERCSKLRYGAKE